MEKSLVSVLLICYNHGAYIEQSIRSVLNQTYSNIELIVIDDFSNDNSREIINNLLTQYKFTFVPNEYNEGLNKSIVKATNMAKGDYISFLASDDYMHVDKTEVELNFLQLNNCDGVYSTGYSVLDEKKLIIQINDVFKQNNKQKIIEFLYVYDWGCPLQQSALLKAKVMKDLIPLRGQYKSDDWAFLIKAYELYNITYIDEPLFYYRLHENNAHKNYWYTYPMRIDIASRLIPNNFRRKSLANINLSQGNYLMADKKFFFALSFFVSSLMLSFKFKTLVSIIKSVGVFFRDYLKR